MDNYRRRSPEPKRFQPVDGLIPVKTNTVQSRQTQPYREAAVRASLETPRRRVEPQPQQQPPQRARLDMSLTDDSCHDQHHAHPVIRRRIKLVQTWTFRLALTAMVLLIGTGGLLFSRGLFSAHKVFRGTAQTAVSLRQEVDPSSLKSEGDSRINILLLGIGGGTHDGPDLTDTLMLASIDPVNNTASLLSIPRDLWVTLPGHGAMKINAAYETGKYGYLHKITADNSNYEAIQAGFTSIDQTLENVIGTTIQYNVLVNFQAFQQAVDTVGGVTIDVPTDLYDPTMAWENHNNPYLARAGTQLMDGPTALRYARSRETSSDFARGQRQRALILALKQKALSLGVVSNPAKLSGLMSAFGNNVKTDLSISDASKLYGVIKKINDTDIKSISLAGNTTTTSAGAATDSLVTTGMLNGQSIVMPKAGLDNYVAIRNYVHSQLQDGFLLREKAPVLVLNGSSLAGLAATTTTTLTSYGYNVVGTGNAPYTAGTIVVDLSHGHDPYTKHYLEQRFSTTAVTTLPAGVIASQNASFVVVLGGSSAQ